MKFETMIILASCALVTLFLLTGCTSTSIEYGKFKADRISVWQSISVKASVSNDCISVEYTNDGGSGTAGKMAGVAVGAALK